MKTHFYAYSYIAANANGVGNGSANINSFEDIGRIQMHIKLHLEDSGYYDITVIITCVYKF